MNTLDIKDNIYLTLREKIINFSLQPGQMLSENSLSNQMNISRSSMRDALSRLIEEHYIVVYPQRGIIVRKINSERVRQAVHTHQVLEGEVVNLLCRQGLKEEQLTELLECLESQRGLTASGNALELLKADLDMHRLLSSYSGHQYIEKLFRTMDCDFMRVMYLQLSTFHYKVYMSSVTSWDHCVLEHRLLLDHLKNRDAEAAGLICMNHFNSFIWNAETLQKIYPQFFSDQEEGSSLLR